MKVTMILVALLFSSVLATFSQSNYPLAVGVEVGYKAGINAADVPTGTKNAVGFANTPDIGLQLYIPFKGQDNMGVLANLGYYTFPYNFTFEGVSGADAKYNASYIGLGADFFVSNFTVGVNYGIPASAKLNDFDLNTETMAGALEFRLGGHIPMMVTSSGRLNLNIRASYFLTGQFQENKLIGGKNTNPASISFGLSYLFNLNSSIEE
ncbi:MAG TPA: hypothetical protein PLE30_01055 [Candidatus Kapabacteria bacterium]|nr:hypothetical protein [Candidatus Kapabacteria bacterium]